MEVPTLTPKQRYRVTVKADATVSCSGVHSWVIAATQAAADSRGLAVHLLCFLQVASACMVLSSLWQLSAVRL